MKLSILNIDKTETGKMELPQQFSEKVRPDIIKRAVLAINANSRQPYGAKKGAGMRASAELSRRRHDYRGSYGIGISRVPRKILSRRGTRMNWVGAVAPGTVKGRRAHPPKAEKVWERKINRKTRRKAIRSAMAAAMYKELVSERGHKVPDNYPFIVSDDIENIKRTKDLIAALARLGLKEELERVAEKKIRAGRGKMRGRKYKTRKGPLLVVADRCDAMDAAKNIAGLNMVTVTRLNARSLAPNATIGRLTIFTKKAMERLEKERLFTDEPKISGVKQKTKADTGKSKGSAANKPEAGTKTAKVKK